MSVIVNLRCTKHKQEQKGGEGREGETLVVFNHDGVRRNSTSVMFVSSTQINHRNVSTCFSGEISCLLLAFPVGILPLFIISLHKIESDLKLTRAETSLGDVGTTLCMISYL